MKDGKKNPYSKTRIRVWFAASFKVVCLTAPLPLKLSDSRHKDIEFLYTGLPRRLTIL